MFKPYRWPDSLGKNIAQPALRSLGMPAALLVLFPLLLMFNSRPAFAALALAIVLLYTSRRKSAHRPIRQPIDDSSI